MTLFFKSFLIVVLLAMSAAMAWIKVALGWQSSVGSFIDAGAVVPASIAIQLLGPKIVRSAIVAVVLVAAVPISAFFFALDHYNVKVVSASERL